MLHAEKLKEWLDILQSKMSGKVTVIYDACSSGTFLSVLGKTDYDRTVITSTTGNENASFNGAISFSNLFWSQIFNGKSINEAFVLTKNSIAATYQQNPLLDSNGNGQGNENIDFDNVNQQYIGNGITNNSTAPKIANVAHTDVLEGENISTIIAYGVEDKEGISSVWGVVTPPWSDLGQDGTPVQNQPRFSLSKVDDDRYEGQFDGFDQPGTYRIAVYAQDPSGNTSFPQVIKINVVDPLGDKAIIVMGIDTSKQLPSDSKRQADYAYDVLTSQGFATENIRYLSANSVASAHVTRLATAESLKFELTEWAVKNTSNVVVYLIGDLKDSQFHINNNEKISISEIDTWLDTLQAEIKGTMTVIHEGNYSGNLITALTASDNKNRIVISSASSSEGSQILAEGSISFSHYFWNQIRQGSNIANAFQYAQSGMRKYQSPQLNDNGNTISNEKTDRHLARQHKIGVGILLAADEPKLQQTSPNTVLKNQEIKSTLWVKNIVSLSKITEVWAIITPPEYNPALQETAPPYKVVLPKIGENHWQINHKGFNQGSGSYQIAFYARDRNDRISQPTTRYIYQPVGQDVYEKDNAFESAKTFQTSTNSPQWHNFHQKNDTDFIHFEAKKSFGQYTIKVDATTSQADPVLTLYNANKELIQSIDDTGKGEQELVFFTPQKDGVYYLSISPFDKGSIQSSALTNYSVQIFPTNAPVTVKIKGNITSKSGSPISGATITTSKGGQFTKTDFAGDYIIKGYIGNYDLIVEASGYQKEVRTLLSKAEEETVQDFTLVVDTESEPEPPKLPISDNTEPQVIPEFKEGNSNHMNYFQISIDKTCSHDISVNYFTRDETAIAAEDYVAVSGTITIPAGMTRALIPVEILGDQKIEKNEHFSLVITDPVGASFPNGVSEISTHHMIINDDE